MTDEEFKKLQTIVNAPPERELPIEQQMAAIREAAPAAPEVPKQSWFSRTLLWFTATKPVEAPYYLLLASENFSPALSNMLMRPVPLNHQRMANGIQQRAPVSAEQLLQWLPKAQFVVADISPMKHNTSMDPRVAYALGLSSNYSKTIYYITNDLRPLSERTTLRGLASHEPKDAIDWSFISTTLKPL